MSQGLSKSLKFLLLVTSGLLRGLILGLLLFLLFVNDLPEAMHNADNYGYTDDFNAIILNQNDMNQATKNIEIGLTIKWNQILKKSHFPDIKSNLNAHLFNMTLASCVPA